ncbi:anti-sigma factor antagonist [Lentzea sp. NPDC005914]|uniref:anti-sigma factor antagonist n=1 Tax=Lentzea sp. NPDC005914 TaxID=3154572 RepID=UPI00340BDB84
MDRSTSGVPDDWSVHTTRDGRIAVVAVAGDVDMSTAPALIAELTNQVDKYPAAVVVDLGAVSFFCSSGINALLDAYERTTSRGIPLHLVAPQQRVVRPLQIAGLSDIFPQHVTLPDAIRAIRRPGCGRMRIAMISEQVSPLTEDLGQGAHVAQLAAALHGLGHEVVVYTRRVDPAVAERVDTCDGYVVVHVPAGPVERLSEDEVVPHLGEFAEFLVERWRLCAPAVVHAHNWTSGLAAVFGASRVQVPVVHSYYETGTQVTEQHADADVLVARRASWIVASSSSRASKLQRLGVRRTSISAMPSSVDVKLFQPDGPAASRGTARRIVAVGKFLEHNGFMDVISALSTLENAELVIVGENARANTFAAQLRESARELGVLDRVVFAGAVPLAQMPALLRSADVVACVPWFEPFGLTALQAMACGVPVVASAVDALDDIVVHNITGLHVPPREPRVLARALRQLLADDTLREEFGIAGRDRVMARYSRDRLAKEAVALYARIARVAADLESEQYIG